MNEFRWYWIPGERKERLKICEHPDCDRLTTAEFCCAECGQSRARQEAGALGDVLHRHSKGCDQRHALRQRATPIE